MVCVSKWTYFKGKAWITLIFMVLYICWFSLLYHFFSSFFSFLCPKANLGEQEMKDEKGVNFHCLIKLYEYFLPPFLLLCIFPLVMLEIIFRAWLVERCWSFNLEGLVSLKLQRLLVDIQILMIIIRNVSSSSLHQYIIQLYVV